MGSIGCVRCEKFRCDFVSRTFALVRPVLHRVCKATKWSRMHPNSTKCTRTSVWGPMGRIECVRCKKFRRDFVARTFAVVRPFCTEFRKATKRSRMHPNSTKCTKKSVSGPMGWIACVRCKKFRRDFVARNFAQVRPVLHRVS